MINKPQPDEYAPYAAGYVGLVNTPDVIGLLGQMKHSTYAMFNNMSEEKAMHSYAEGKWTLKQVLGHLIDTERTFSYRAFAFSRASAELPGFDQDVYMANADFNSRSIQELASEYKAVRESTLFLYKAFSAEQLLRKGVASNHPVSVRALVYMTAGHELHHLKIVKEKYF
ncbi:MAG TPA: DinB family protein [Mucilaginibacter sp.]|nr:DinB family protein [Mucilaginibacter sp.]